MNNKAPKKNPYHYEELDPERFQWNADELQFFIDNKPLGQFLEEIAAFSREYCAFDQEVYSSSIPWYSPNEIKVNDLYYDFWRFVFKATEHSKNVSNKTFVVLYTKMALINAMNSIALRVYYGTPGGEKDKNKASDEIQRKFAKTFNLNLPYLFTENKRK